MTLQLAKAMIEAAIEKADADYAQPICVSVCDTAGFLTAFNRVEGVPLRCVHNAAGGVIGGLGISGMKAEEDAAVARVAVEIARTFG
jgi:uncharacterized protein GlcG (DUF336 family)